MDAQSTRDWPRCSFRLQDVVCPDRSQILMQIAADLEVTGEIALLSDRGEERNRFAIVDVEGIASPLIVPVECLRPASATGAGPDKPRATATFGDSGSQEVEEPRTEKAAS